jgi:class 3 adenylate cyclase
MIFVNEVAEIVHEITAEYCGSVNKNIGDAFLLVWKFHKKYVKLITNKKGELKLQLKKTIQVSQLCDMSLISAIKILMEIQRSHKLSKYRKHKKLNERMKNYRTKLGFGLHLGQSIEGAIGSMFKIDASYLSSNVDQSNNLEENTKTFLKELIMSGEFYDYLSQDSKSNLRLLDIFKTKSGEIQRLYSIDLNLEILPEEKPENSNFKTVSIGEKMIKIREIRIETRFFYEDVVNRFENEIWNDFVYEDDDYKLVRKKYTDSSFIKSYNEGMELFQKGNWEEAQKKLENAKEILGENDPACERNLEYMKKYDFKAPPTWKGYKEN